jgi:hypothetical protein
MGRLERKLDMSLVRRIKARPDGSLYIPRTEAKPIHTVKPPRDASDYRGAQRNADRIKGWPSATFAKSRPLAPAFGAPLNRSQNLPHAKTYAKAAEIAIRRGHRDAA